MCFHTAGRNIVYIRSGGLSEDIYQMALKHVSSLI